MFQPTASTRQQTPIQMEIITDILHIVKKVNCMKVLEKLNIYSETKCGNEINDKHTLEFKKIFRYNSAI
jgi:hypothetical protein